MKSVKLKYENKCPWNGTIIGKNCSKCVCSKVIHKEYIYCAEIVVHCDCCSKASINNGGMLCEDIRCRKGNKFVWDEKYNHLIYDFKEPDEIIEF